ARGGRHRAGRSSLLDDGYVIAVVYEFQFRVAGLFRRGDGDSGGVENFEFAGKLDRQLDPDRREWMTGTEVVAEQAVIPGNMRGTGHAVSTTRSMLAGRGRLWLADASTNGCALQVVRSAGDSPAGCAVGWRLTCELCGRLATHLRVVRSASYSV